MQARYNLGTLVSSGFLILSRRSLNSHPPREYRLAGLSLRSDLALPELEELPPGRERADVTIRRSSVPKHLPGGSRPDPWVQIDGDRVLVTIEGIARYLVVAGKEVLVDAESGANDRDVRVFLLGSAFGALCFQLGFFPLHASVVVIDRRAVAFAADSGGGKSTLAAWMHRCGFPLLCDDVCVLRFDPDGRPIAYPGFPRLKLWSDALAHLGLPSRGLQRDLLREDKYQVPVSSGVAKDPAPLTDVFFLEYGPDDSPPRVDPVHPARGLVLVRDQTYRYQYISGLGLSASHFEDCARIARAVRLHRLVRPRQLSGLPESQARIVEALR